MSDLIERLRAETVDPFAPGLRHVSYVNPEGPEAADEIERLRSDIARIANRCIRPVSRAEIRAMCADALERRPQSTDDRKEA